MDVAFTILVVVIALAFMPFAIVGVVLLTGTLLAAVGALIALVVGAVMLLSHGLTEAIGWVSEFFRKKKPAK